MSSGTCGGTISSQLSSPLAMRLTTFPRATPRQADHVEKLMTKSVSDGFVNTHHFAARPSSCEHLSVKGVANCSDTTLVPGALARGQRHAETFSNAFYCAEQLRRRFGLSARCKTQPRTNAQFGRDALFI